MSFEGVCVTTVILAPGACGREVRTCSPTPISGRSGAEFREAHNYYEKLFFFTSLPENDRHFQTNLKTNTIFTVMISLTEFCSIGAEFRNAHNYCENQFVFYNFAGK